MDVAASTLKPPPLSAPCHACLHPYSGVPLRARALPGALGRSACGLKPIRADRIGSGRSAPPGPFDYVGVTPPARAEGHAHARAHGPKAEP